MSKKAQMDMIGLILVIFLTVIVGLVLFGASVQNIGQSTTLARQNTSSGSAALVIGTPGVSQNLEGKFVDTSTFLAINQTNGATIASGNYTILNNRIVNGELRAVINASGERAVAGQQWNVSYTFQPVGYIPDAGGRSIAGLIAIFMALGIMVVALIPTLRSGVMDLLGR